MADKVNELIGQLRDKVWYIRKAAAKALGEIGDARAVEPLISALRDEDWHVRKAAAEALGEIKNPRAVEPLISTLRDKDSYVRKAAAEALDKIKQTNAHVLTSYPYLFCPGCYMRAEIRKVRTGIFKKEAFVSCRHCNRSGFLMKGIKHIIGLIGGDIHRYKVDRDRVYV